MYYPETINYVRQLQKLIFQLGETVKDRFDGHFNIDCDCTLLLKYYESLKLKQNGLSPISNITYTCDQLIDSTDEILIYEDITIYYAASLGLEKQAYKNIFKNLLTEITKSSR